MNNVSPKAKIRKNFVAETLLGGSQAKNVQQSKEHLKPLETIESNAGGTDRINMDD